MISFRPHRPVTDAPWRAVAAANYLRLHGREPTASDLANASERVDIGGRTVTTWARWAAAAMLCPYASDEDPRASYCAATRCRRWVDDGTMSGFGTCAEIER